MMKSYLDLLRVNEWYKNITVVIGAIFAVYLLRLEFSQSLLINLIIITILSCLISSANYLLNALTDINFDKKHPIKKLRPLPSKKIRPETAFVIMFILVIISLASSYLLFGFKTTFILFSLFVAALFYDLKPIRLKDVPYLDVLSESVNNPIRFLIGWSIIIVDKFPNIFILLLVWFSACFLMTRKRLKELIEFHQKMVNYRKVFIYYSKKSLNISMSIYILTSLVLIGLIIYTGIV